MTDADEERALPPEVEKAFRIIRTIAKDGINRDNHAQWHDLYETTFKLRNAIRDTRTAALEEAAKIAERIGGPLRGEHASSAETSHLVGRDIASAIRSMRKGE